MTKESISRLPAEETLSVAKTARQLLMIGSAN